MILRATVAPFTVVTLAAVFVFGVVVPYLEKLYNVSADGPGGGRSAREAERMVAWSWDDAMQCFGVTAGRAPGTGRVVLRATVQATGIVESVSVLESGDRANTQNECLVRLVRAWRFEPSRKERTIDLVFDPAQRAFEASD